MIFLLAASASLFAASLAPVALAQVAAYGQCGGIGYSGSTTCVAGYSELVFCLLMGMAPICNHCFPFSLHVWQCLVRVVPSKSLSDAPTEPPSLPAIRNAYQAQPLPRRRHLPIPQLLLSQLQQARLLPASRFRPPLPRRVLPLGHRRGRRFSRTSSGSARTRHLISTTIFSPRR